MNKVLIKDGKAILYDDRWITIGGEDEDGSGQHVLIKENGTIVAGFGKGKNVKNAFSEKRNDGTKATITKEEAQKAVSEAERKYKAAEEKRNREAELEKSRKNYKEWEQKKDSVETLEKERTKIDRMIEARRRQMQQEIEQENELLKKGVVTENVAKENNRRSAEWADSDIKKLEEERDYVDKLIKNKKNGVVEKIKPEPNASKKDYEKAEPNKQKYSEYGGYNPPEYHGTKEEIFKQATEAANKTRAEKEKRERSEARATLKRAETGLAEAKAKGDVKAQSFWEAARNRAEKTLTPSEQYKLDMERAENRRNAAARRKEAEKLSPSEQYKRDMERAERQGETSPNAKGNEPKKMVKVEPNKVTITKQSGSVRTAKPKEPKSANINGGRRLEYDDDVVKIYRNGKLEYHGIEDDSPYHHDDNWKWNASKGYYEIDHPTGKYVMVVPK